MIAEAIGFLAFLLNLGGNLLLTWKNKWGWIIRIGANAVWSIYSLQIWSVPMLLNGLTFFILNIYGFRRWHMQCVLSELRRGHSDHCNLKPCSCGRFA